MPQPGVRAQEILRRPAVVRDWLAPRVVFPLYERLSGRRPWTELRRLRALQWRSPEELEARAMAKLRPLLAHASAQVPYYRELFERAGIRPDDIRTTSDLSRLPVTGKADLRANFPARVVADNVPAARRQPAITSGSTGLPLEFYIDRSSRDLRDARALLFNEWAGVTGGDTWVWIGPWGVPRWAGDPGSWRLRRAARRILFGGRFVGLDGMVLTADRFRHSIGGLSGRDRYYIQGFTAYIARLAAQLLEAGTELPAAPMVVITTAETQTAADVAAIERAFRCPVIDRYASWETGTLAQTCPDNPAVLHAESEGHLLRAIREDGSPASPGESGRLVVSDLENWVMPFINYDLGDRAVAGAPCPCGRGLPTFMGLEGRMGEVIQTKAGKTISPGSLGLHRVPRALEYVWEYQAVQTAPDAVAFRVVPTPRFTPEFSRELEAYLADLLGPGMSVRVETVDRIAVEPSGKRLIVKSELPPG